MAPEQAALAQIADAAALYGVSPSRPRRASVNVSQNRQGVKVVTLAQEADGIEVFRQSLKVLLDRNNELVAVSGSLPPHVPKAASPRLLPAPGRRGRRPAYQDLTGTALDASLLPNVKAQGAGKYTHFELATSPPPGGGAGHPGPRQAGALLAADRAGARLLRGAQPGAPDSTDSDYYAYVISAADGRVLLRNNLTADADFTLPRVGGHHGAVHPLRRPRRARRHAAPHRHCRTATRRRFIAAEPGHAAERARSASNDPWLPAGATQTTGNNVDAYADLGGARRLQRRRPARRPSPRRARSTTPTTSTQRRTSSPTSSKAAVTQPLLRQQLPARLVLRRRLRRGRRQRAGQQLRPRRPRRTTRIHAEAQDYSGTQQRQHVHARGRRAPAHADVRVRRRRRTLQRHRRPAASRATTTRASRALRPADVRRHRRRAIARTRTRDARLHRDGCTAAHQRGTLAGKIALIDRGTLRLHRQGAERPGRRAPSASSSPTTRPAPAPALGGTGRPAITIPVAVASPRRTATPEGRRWPTGTVNVRMRATADLDRDGTHRQRRSSPTSGATTSATASSATPTA